MKDKTIVISMWTKPVVSNLQSSVVYYVSCLLTWVDCNTYYDKVDDFQELINGRSFYI